MRIVSHVRKLYYRLNGSFRRANGELIQLRDADGRLTLSEVSDTLPNFRPTEFVIYVNGRPELVSVIAGSSWR